MAEENPARARALVARIEDRCEILKAWPLRGRLRPEFGGDIHSFAVSPFVVFYRLVDEGKVIEVATVIDGRRDLGTVFFE